MNKKEVIPVQKELLDELVDKAEKFDQIKQQLAEKEDKLIQKDKVIADCKELLKDICENFDGVDNYCENWCNWLIYKKEHDRPIYVSKEMFEKLKNSDCLYEPKIDFEEENKVLKQQLIEKDKEIEKLRNYREELEKLSKLLSEHDERNLNIIKIEKQLRKEICDEIRECLNGNKRLTLYIGIYEECYFCEKVEEILNQIEKGGK